MNHDVPCLSYLRLAAAAHQKGLGLPRNRLLFLAGLSALKAGWMDVAERCREVILHGNPQHALHNHETFAEALRSGELDGMIRSHERFCSPERAEHVLAESGLTLSPSEEPQADALRELAGMG